MAIILGIKLSDLKKDELQKRLEFFLNDQTGHFLATPNPEIILRAGHDEEYFYILNSADIAIADGFGLVLAGKLKGEKITRITGSELTPWLLKLAEGKGHRTLIINWKDGLSSGDDIKNALLEKWPKLICQVLDIERKESLSGEENEKINNFAPALIFVTIGAPLQEKLIWHSLPQWKSARLALAVGGSFDFITGKIKKAPQIFSAIGLEWLWRLIKQPSRFKRIWNATVVFSLKAFHSIVIQPFLFRSNVAIMLYKKTPEGIKILLVARQDNHDHWQIPQGGCDGQKLEVAGTREIREELNTDKFKIIKSIKNLNVYEFAKLGLNSGKSGYKGQKQGLLIAEFTGKDEDIKINYWDHCAYKWVSIDNFIETTHPIRRAGYTKFLTKFIETIK